jgi:hypothetical protein
MGFVSGVVVAKWTNEFEAVPVVHVMTALLVVTVLVATAVITGPLDVVNDVPVVNVLVLPEVSVEFTQ